VRRKARSAIFFFASTVGAACGGGCRRAGVRPACLISARDAHVVPQRQIFPYFPPSSGVDVQSSGFGRRRDSAAAVQDLARLAISSLDHLHVSQSFFAHLAPACLIDSLHSFARVVRRSICMFDLPHCSIQRIPCFEYLLHSLFSLLLICGNAATGFRSGSCRHFILQHPQSSGISAVASNDFGSRPLYCQGCRHQANVLQFSRMPARRGSQLHLVFLARLPRRFELVAIRPHRWVIRANCSANPGRLRWHTLT